MRDVERSYFLRWDELRRPQLHPPTPYLVWDCQSRSVSPGADQHFKQMALFDLSCSHMREQNHCSRSCLGQDVVDQGLQHPPVTHYSIVMPQRKACFLTSSYGSNSPGTTRTAEVSQAQLIELLVLLRVKLDRRGQDGLAGVAHGNVWRKTLDVGSSASILACSLTPSTRWHECVLLAQAVAVFSEHALRRHGVMRISRRSEYRLLFEGHCTRIIA